MCRVLCMWLLFVCVFAWGFPLFMWPDFLPGFSPLKSLKCHLGKSLREFCRGRGLSGKRHSGISRRVSCDFKNALLALRTADERLWIVNR